MHASTITTGPSSTFVGGDEVASSRPGRTSMRAIIQPTYGSAEVLRVAEIERPTIGVADVLVRVHAAGLDRGTWHLMAGKPYLVRLPSPRKPMNLVAALMFPAPSQRSEQR